MKTSKKGLDLIASFEGLGPEYAKSKRIVAYRCPAGKPTIGYGHTRSVTESDIGKREISIDEARRLLAADVAVSEAYVNRLPTIGILNQNQFDALVSLAFNVGSFGGSLKDAIKRADWDAVAATMKRYIHGDGRGYVTCNGACGVANCKLRMLPGLKRRREAEVQLFKGT